jgi:hypothetical protein
MSLNPDDFDEKVAFKLLKHLCENIGVRVSGSSTEEKTAEYIFSEFKKIDQENSSKEMYPHNYFEGKEATITQLPDGEVIRGKPMWMTKSTIGDGIEGTGYYLGSVNQIEDIPLLDIQEKIIFVFFLRDYLEPEVFTNLKKLYRLKPKGVVLLSNFNQNVTRSDPFIEDESIFAQIPTMVIPAARFTHIEDFDFNKEFRLKIKGVTNEGSLHNVVLEKKGKRKETILLCSHHDTVEYSVGARDSAAATAVLVELAKRISSIETEFSYIFASFGGEEQGLDGAWKFIENRDLSDIVLCLEIHNIDNLPGFIASIVAGDEDLHTLIREQSLLNDYPTLTVNSITNRGNSMVFVHEGIPSILFMVKGATEPGIYNTPLDTAEKVKEDSLKKLGSYLLKLINRLEIMDELELSSGIPSKLEEDAVDFFRMLEFYNES